MLGFGLAGFFSPSLCGAAAGDLCPGASGYRVAPPGWRHAGVRVWRKPRARAQSWVRAAAGPVSCRIWGYTLRSLTK